ncbi:MAG: hypothetical protein WC692_03985 [Erythrobacter sp.]|jgi:hypothetical protein
MELPPLLLQTAGSLVAILALAGFARWMKLGGTPLLTDDDGVRRAAGEVEGGFMPVSIARDARGLAALARDAQGRIMVIKRHGNRFAGRILDERARAMLNKELGETLLVVMPGQTLFGAIHLDIDAPRAWAEAINRVNGRQDA